jgi:signal transduction histidine kinase
MRSLFLKIFLWFGLAMIFVNVAAFVTGVISERRSQPPRPSPMAQMFGVYAQTAVEVFEKDGKAELASYLERVEGASHIRAVMLNEQGDEVSGRAIPDGAKELAKRASDSSSYIFEFSKQRQKPLGAQPIRGTNGALYVMVGELPRPDFPWAARPGESGSLFFGLRILGRFLLPLLVIGALFCYGLARYLSTPIVQLRGATQGLADGNLGVRVDRKLLKRHDEIGKLGRDFNLMAARIESLIEAHRRLLGDISHELRSPLARQGVALGLARRRANPEASSALDRIGREAERINAMIGQLLDLSRVENDTDGLNSTEIDLGLLVQEVVEDADFEARDRDRSVRLVTCDPCIVTGVADLLRSAIENVVRNAARHTAVNTEVEIALHCNGGAGGRSAVISVRDHGAGVPEAAIEEIFRPFYRVDDARDRKTGGAGLGLAIATRAVHLHGGSIKATNAAEGGLLVEINLPTSQPV